MAHVVTGIDVGAHSVKFVLIDVGFRHAKLMSTFEEVVPAGEAPLTERQGEALQIGLARLPAEAIPYMALPGEMLAVRALDLPFSDARKIEQVVGYELEGQIVHALQDVVYDHVVCKARGGEGSTVLAAAARVDEVGDLLAGLNVRGVEPRSLFVAPVVYQALFSGDKTPAPGEPACRLLLDIGHRRTNVCFLLHGETVYARTLLRGGEGLTAAVAAAFQCSPDRAERAKREEGVVGSANRRPQGPIPQRMDEVLRETLAPLLREIRQTIASFRAREKATIEGVLLTGGTGALVGLDEYLAEELALPVAPYVPESAGRMIDPPAGAPGEGRFTLATAIAWAGARGGKELDLRRGPFQYKASFSVLRQKAAHLGGLAAALLICATVDGSMSLSRLSKEKETLQAQLRTATTELFGEPRMDAKAVSANLRKKFSDEMAPIPKATAYDLLGELSKRIPPNITLDITDLDIRPKKVTIRGTIDSATSVDDMVGQLKQIDCFEEITKGPVTEVSGGSKQFLLTINSKCP
ncbi:MAG TPA: pilus assembly protein PilM [Polyangia bacterium]|nr:pilus assembly protein PilM [Polyangia bacterium]